MPASGSSGAAQALRTPHKSIARRVQTHKGTSHEWETLASKGWILLEGTSAFEHDIFLTDAGMQVLVRALVHANKYLLSAEEADDLLVQLVEGLILNNIDAAQRFIRK
jgi:hypothetical protein